MRGKHTKQLFDGDDDLNPSAQKLSINEDYAKRFEHNKKREQLHRLQEKYPEIAAKLERKAASADAGENQSSDSDSEDEDDGQLPAQTEAQILLTLLKLKRKDPEVYDPVKKFFDDEDADALAGAGTGSTDAEGAENNRPRKRKRRTVQLKDVIAQQALAGEQASSSDNDEVRDGDASPTYAEQQRRLKRDFLAAADSAARDAEAAAVGDGLVLKQRTSLRAGGVGVSGEHASEAKVNQLLDAYFGDEQELTADDRFLKSFIQRRGWVEHGDSDSDGGSGGAAVDSEDDEFLDLADKFEAKYNFRFEEPGSSVLVSHPRVPEQTLRKADSRRKAAREAREARHAADEQQRQEEVKRLKNLTKQQIEEKLARVRGVAGSAADDMLSGLDTLLEGDFDPEDYDRRMAAAFDDTYYEAGNGEGEDEIFGDEAVAGLSDDERQPGKDLPAPLASTREEWRSKQGRPHSDSNRAHGHADDADTGQDIDADQEHTDDGDGGARDDHSDEDSGDEPGGDAALAEAARARAELSELLHAYRQLDYEDVVGGLQCRFRYKQVNAAWYGLDADAVLALPERELNSVVGLRKLAPYQPEEHRIKPNYSALQRAQAVLQRRLRRQAAAQKPPAGSGKARPGPDQHEPSEKRSKKKKAHGGPAGEAGDDATARRQSYAPLTLSKGAQLPAGTHKKKDKRKHRDDEGAVQDGGKHRKRSKERTTGAPKADTMAASLPTPTLTPAQRKNLKRSMKRAAKREGQ